LATKAVAKVVSETLRFEALRFEALRFEALRFEALRACGTFRRHVLKVCHLADSYCCDHRHFTYVPPLHNQR
jgi:hypothetical protein